MLLKDIFCQSEGKKWLLGQLDAFIFSVLPVCYSPGVKAANSLMSHNTQVGLVLFAVSPDVSQHAAWHGENSPPVLLHWAREREAASGPLLVVRYVLRQAVLRGHSVLEETQEDAPDIFPQHLFITLTVQAV